MMRRAPRRSPWLFGTLAIVACGQPTPVVTAPAPVVTRDSAVSAPSPAPPLPPIPKIEGPLAIKVVYPDPNQQLTSRDSNFIFGSVGDGRASVFINGSLARV